MPGKHLHPQLSIRLEEDLLKDFKDRSKYDDRSQTEILRDLIRQYVNS